jgi:hypothetical protein
MNRVYLLIGGIVCLGSIYVIAPIVTDSYRRYRNRRTVICPETGQIAEVDLKAVQASLISALGKHWVRVKWCSLWPRKKGCAEECVENGSAQSHNSRVD